MMFILNQTTRKDRSSFAARGADFFTIDPNPAVLLYKRLIEIPVDADNGASTAARNGDVAVSITTQTIAHAPDDPKPPQGHANPK